PPDHFLLFQILVRRQRRIHHRVGQNAERSGHALFWYVDPKDRAIEGGVGVDVTADILDFLRDGIARLRFCALEEHMLENVREPCAKSLVFFDAAGRTPGLYTCHW